MGAQAQMVQAAGSESRRRSEDSTDGLSDRNRRGAAQPPYLTIAESIAARISSGTYAAGSRIPSVSQLTVEFGVSPMTVNRALAVLKERDLVSSIKGRGTFARSTDLSDSLFRLGSVTGGWLGERTEIRLLSVSIARADERSAAQLCIPVGERVVNVRRLVSQAGTPMMFHAEYVIADPLRPLLESQLLLTSLHAFLRSERGQRFPGGELRIRAVQLDAEVAELLEEREGTPALCLQHLFRDSSNRPVSVGRFLLRADQFELTGQLGSDRC